MINRVSFIALFFTYLNALGQIAFPSAEGFGKNTTGGRGGQVIHVTNLNDSGPGSLREALQTTGPRIIVFDVGGTIQLAGEVDLRIGSTNPTTNATLEDVTIAGETAPSPGISIKGGGIEIYTSNVIIRYVTVRVDIASVETSDAIQIRNWGSGYDLRNIMIDHVSLSHGSDENFNIDGANANDTAEDITIQYAILGENSQQNKHILLGTHRRNISILNTYMVEASSRNPLIGYGSNSEEVEVINTIVYGGNAGAAISRGNIADVLANVYRPYPTGWSFNVVTLGSQGYGNPVGTGSIFVDGNFIDDAASSGVAEYNSELLTYNGSQRVITNSLVTGYNTVRADIENDVLTNAGNNLFRDTFDTDWVNNYINQDGSRGYNPFTPLSQTTRPGSDDSDNDDMLDVAEIAIWGNITTTNSSTALTNGVNITVWNAWTDIEKTHFYLSGEDAALSPPPKKSSLSGGKSISVGGGSGQIYTGN